jgi:hypothetical protein
MMKINGSDIILYRYNFANVVVQSAHPAVETFITIKVGLKSRDWKRVQGSMGLHLLNFVEKSLTTTLIKLSLSVLSILFCLDSHEYFRILQNVL